MRLTEFRVQNFRSIRDSGWLAAGPVTVLIGANNSGKSALLDALASVQQSGSPPRATRRIGATGDTLVSYRVANLKAAHWGRPLGDAGAAEVDVAFEGDGVSAVMVDNADGQAEGWGQIGNISPQHWIQPFRSTRRVSRYDESIGRMRTQTIVPDHTSLPALFDLIHDSGHPKNAIFESLVSAMTGLRLSARPAANDGQKEVGQWLGDEAFVHINEMGSGVAQILGFLIQICLADGKLFLIEEPENDLHPQALKRLLDLIQDSSEKNQFVVSTHSHVVLKHLGSLPSTQVYELTQQADEAGVPETTISAIPDSDPVQRARILRDMGFELSDFDLVDGWIIFEEATAERFARQISIPWFVPKLGNYGTIGCRGVSDLDRTAHAVEKVVLFTHLQKPYMGNVLVVADGDEAGVGVTTELRKKFEKWTPEAFANLDVTDVEFLYPAVFLAEAKEILAMGHGQTKQRAKKELLGRVISWCLENPEARRECESSAKSLISLLDEFANRQ